MWVVPTGMTSAEQADHCSQELTIDDGVMLCNCAFGAQLPVQMGALQITAGILEHSKSGKAQNMRGKLSILESKPDAEAAWKPPG